MWEDLLLCFLRGDTIQLELIHKFFSTRMHMNIAKIFNVKKLFLFYLFIIITFSLFRIIIHTEHVGFALVFNHVYCLGIMTRQKIHNKTSLLGFTYPRGRIYSKFRAGKYGPPFRSMTTVASGLSAYGFKFPCPLHK
jgi:hypothetical protein